MIDPEDILQFWFGDATNAPENAEARMSLRFDASPGVDAQIRAGFSATVEAAARGRHASWVRAPRPALAFVVLLDQFRETSGAELNVRSHTMGRRSQPPDWRSCLESFLPYAQQHLGLGARPPALAAAPRH